MKNRMSNMEKSLWTKTEKGWVAEISTLQQLSVKRCPGCEQLIGSLGTPDRAPSTAEEIGEVMGWRQTHFCGAEIVIVND